MDDIMALPLRMQKALSASATMSIAPVIAITAPVSRANAFANLTASARFASVTLSATSASTPLVVPLPEAMVFISEMFPRMTENFTSRTRPSAVSVRRLDAPAPTGSRTTGCPSSFALLPAMCIDSIVRLFSVPILILRPEHTLVISATSALSSAMIGDAPHASAIFAQSLTVT